MTGPEHYRAEGPFPLTVHPTDTGADIDISGFLRLAVLTELVTQAAEDPHGVGEELAAVGDLLSSAIAQGRDSHARHEFDEQMHQLVDRYAAGGRVPVYHTGLRQLRDVLAEITAPRPVPSQERRRTA